MPGWPPFELHSLIYDLSHLNVLDCVFTQPATTDKPERRYRVKVEFGHHCFTRGLRDEDPDELIYPEPRQDLRAFDPERWALSHQLPELIRDLMTREVRHTNHGNFLTIELTDLNGEPVEYEVYFNVTKTGKQLYLVVSSAFPRDPARLGARAQRRTMKLALILHNVQVGKPIRPPENRSRRH